jgi:hypothetical protein
VPIKNLHNGGEFQKYVNVTTNAKNNATFRLSISGEYHPLIELEPSNNLRLSSAKEKDTGEIIAIKTSMKDLKITEVQFKDNGKELDFKANIPLQFSVLPLDSVKPKNDQVKKEKASGKNNPGTEQQAKRIYVHKLRVKYVPFSKAETFGEFVIKTNQKEYPEIKLSGVLEAKKE